VSAKSTTVTERHFDYIASHTLPEDAFLASLKTAALRAGIRPIWISPEQAAFMQIVLRLTKAKVVVEVGTLAGYSAIAMARALPPDGKVHTIEIDSHCADFAEDWIARSDMAGMIKVHRGAGADVLKRFEDASADAMFLDADKKNYPLYLREAMRILKPGGMVMVDNAFAFGQLFDPNPTDAEAPSVKSFNEYIHQMSGLRSVIVPIGDGCWLGVKD
jgi:predicted O-methyltransferase YrrM